MLCDPRWTPYRQCSRTCTSITNFLLRNLKARSKLSGIWHVNEFSLGRRIKWNNPKRLENLLRFPKTEIHETNMARFFSQVRNLQSWKKTLRTFHCKALKKIGWNHLYLYFMSSISKTLLQILNYFSNTLCSICRSSMQWPDSQIKPTSLIWTFGLKTKVNNKYSLTLTPVAPNSML